MVLANPFLRFTKTTDFLTKLLGFTLIFLSLLFGIPRIFLLQGIPCFSKQFPFFPKDFRGMPRRKILVFLSFSLLFTEQGRKERSGCSNPSMHEPQPNRTVATLNFFKSDPGSIFHVRPVSEKTLSVDSTWTRTQGYCKRDSGGQRKV